MQVWAVSYCWGSMVQVTLSQMMREGIDQVKFSHGVVRLFLNGIALFSSKFRCFEAEELKDFSLTLAKF